jgi:hypothetical protein
VRSAPACCPPADERPDLRPVEGDEADEELAALSKALGHPARVKIVRILCRKNACVCGDIVDELPLAQSTCPSTSRCSRRQASSAATWTDRASATASSPTRSGACKALVGGL